MGINSLLQQDMQGTGLAGIDRLASNAMYPQSQQVNTQFATPSQMPTSAEVVNAGYEPKVNAYTGMPVQNFADGGIARLAVGGSAEEKQAELIKAYKAALGRDPDENAQQWLGDLETGSAVDLANRLAQTEEGMAYGKSNPKEVFANMVGLTQQNSPFRDVETPVDYSGLKYIAAATDAEGNPTYSFQDQNSGMLTVDASGNPISYDPGKSWYDEQRAANPNAFRSTDYRNQTYLAAGPLADKYNFQGVDVPVNAAEYQVDPNTGEFITDKNGNYKPVEWRPRGYDMWSDWAGPAAVIAIPALAAAATYAAPYLAAEGAALMGPTYAELGYAGAAQGLGATGAGAAAELMGPTYGELGITGLAEGMAGPTYAEMGYTGLNQAEAIAQADAAAKTGMTARQARAAKMGLDMLTSGTGGQQPGGYAAPTASAPATIPTVNRFGVTGYEGQIPVAEVAQRPILLSKIKGVGGDYTFAEGGIATLGSYSDGGQLLKGPGDGMSDNIPAKIGEAQPARLADGEFVIPADVVSHLGNGSTDAGAKQLYSMMDKIRKARTGNKKQGKQINPSKFLP